MRTTNTSIPSTTIGHLTRGARHRILSVLIGLAGILLGLVSMTFAAKHPPNPVSIPLPISGTTDEKGIPVGWDLEAFHNHAQIKLEPLKDGQFGIRLLSEESSFGLHKSIEVDLKEFPILTWRWKVDRLRLKGRWAGWW